MGIICNKIGGYTSKNGMIMILLLNLIACVFSIFITVSLNTFISLGSSWMYLFCFAAVTPLQGGVIIASLPKELKGNGFSINMFFLNCLGSFPSSYVFANIADYIKENYPEQGDMRYRTTMRITMFYSWVAMILVGIAGFLRLRMKGKFGSIEKDEDKKEEENNEEEKREEENKDEDKKEEEKKEDNEEKEDNEKKENNEDEI